MLYLNNIEDPDSQTSIIDVINNTIDLQKTVFLASSDIGQSIQEEINLVVTDDKFNDATVYRALDPFIKMF